MKRELLIEARGTMTITDLAARIGVTRIHLSRVENGWRGLPKELRNKLAQVLGVAPESLGAITAGKGNRK